MAIRVPSAQLSTPVNSLDGIQPQAVKAVHRRPSRIGLLIAEAMRRGEGSQKAAAIVLDKDEAQLTRELKAGTLRVSALDDLNPASLAGLGALLTDTYGPLDPKEQIRRAIREARTHLDLAADLAGDLK